MKVIDFFVEGIYSGREQSRDINRKTENKEKTMGTILYLILRLSGRFETPADLVNICFLVSLDSIATLLLLHLQAKKSKA